MLDLVRLRRAGSEASSLLCGQLCLEAADEIERLRELIASAAEELEKGLESAQEG